MNKDQIKGTAKDIKGKIKEKVGHLTGNSKTETDGVGGQVAGKVQKAFGKIKEKVKK